MMQRLNKIGGVVTLLIVSLSVQAQQRHEITVKEAVDLAYKNVVELKNKTLDYKIQEAMNSEILGRALPQVTGNAGAQYYYKLPVFLFPDASKKGIYDVLIAENLLPSGTVAPDPVLQPISLQQPWNGSLGVTLTQLLFQPDVFVGLQARSASLLYAEKNMEVSKEKIKDSAYKRYYAVLIAEKQLTFINDGVKRIEKLVHDNEIMYKNGFIEKLDIDRANVQLSNLKTAQTTLRNGIYLSYAALKFALGIPQKDTLALRDTLTMADIKNGLLDESFRYEDRKEYQLLQTARELQTLDVKRYKMGYIPTISLMGNYSRQGQSAKFIFNKDAFWYSTGYVGLNISVPIFDGLQRKYQIRQSLLKLQQVDNNLDNLKQGIDFQQTVARETIKNAILNLDEQQKNIALAETVYSTTKKKFEQGLGSSFDIIQAETDLQSSQSNYFQAMYDAIIARINYLSATGKL
ncbi:MAG TPA: TolC family protein [Chitinophagaceae bacterium]|nr:TolC family protein [Chitinophagaceae bacterium]